MWTVLSKDRARAKTKWRKKDHTQVVAAKCDRPVIRWSVAAARIVSLTTSWLPVLR